MPHEERTLSEGRKSSSTQKWAKDQTLYSPHTTQGAFPMTATTLFGLEPVLADELRALGAEDVAIGRRAVTFLGDKALLYRLNYRLRCALRILVPILSFEAQDTDQLYSRLLAYDWHSLMPIDGKFFIDTAVHSTYFTNSRYALYRMKDAIRDFDKTSAFPHNLTASDNRQGTLCLHLHISEQTVTISLDSSGESLHHRGYRTGYNSAPLNEVLAAGMLKLAGYDGSVSFYDPMCGSGTLPIEAAMIASDTPAGFYRDNFAFKHWVDFDPELWNSIKGETKRRPITKPIIARDRDFRTIGIATGNIIKATFRRSITIEQADFLTADIPVGPLLLVTNPPYGKRVTHEDLSALYEGLGERLKHGFAGSTAWILASPATLFHKIGLASGERIKLFNGDLECEFRKFELFEGKRKDFVTRKLQGDDARPKRYDKQKGERKRLRFEHKHDKKSLSETSKPPRKLKKTPGIQLFGSDEKI